jgi:hypothetical protein
MDKCDTLEYSRVKAIMVSVCLQNSLCALININKLFSTIAREATSVKILIMILMSTNLAYN